MNMMIMPLLLASWFGPSKQDVSAAFENWSVYSTGRPGICIKFTNNSNQNLTFVEMRAWASIPGRSSEYAFIKRNNVYDSPFLDSDLILTPHQSGIECFEGEFSGVPAGSKIYIRIEVEDVRFK